MNPEPVAGMLAITNSEVGLPAAQKEAPCPAAPQTVAAPAVMPVPSKEAAAETQLARQPSEEVVEKVAEEIDAPPKPAAKRLTLEQSLVELNRARQDGDKGESVEEVPEESELCLKRPAAKTSKTSGKTSKTAGSSEVKPKAKPKAKGKCSPKAKAKALAGQKRPSDMSREEWKRLKLASIPQQARSEYKKGCQKCRFVAGCTVSCWRYRGWDV